MLKEKLISILIACFILFILSLFLQNILFKKNDKAFIVLNLYLRKYRLGRHQSSRPDKKSVHLHMWDSLCLLHHCMSIKIDDMFLISLSLKQELYHQNRLSDIDHSVKSNHRDILCIGCSLQMCIQGI